MRCEIKSICEVDWLNSSIGLNASGCNSYDEVQEACEPSGIYESRFPIIIIYPNPDEYGILNIKIEDNYSNQKRLSFINTLGQEVHEESLFDGKCSINVSEWKSGIYLVLIYDNNKLIGRSKFIVN